MVAALTIWSPALSIFNILIIDAAWPDVVHRAPIPPSNEAIFSSTAPTVGLDILEYICPSAVKSNNLPIWSVDS